MGTPGSSKALSRASTSAGSSWAEIMRTILSGNSMTQKMVKGLGQRVKSLEVSQLRTGRILADAQAEVLGEAEKQVRVNELVAFREQIGRLIPMKDDDMIKTFDKVLSDASLEASCNDATNRVIIILCLKG
jgi:hypothetical protein